MYPSWLWERDVLHPWLNFPFHFSIEEGSKAFALNLRECYILIWNLFSDVLQTNENMELTSAFQSEQHVKKELARRMGELQEQLHNVKEQVRSSTSVFHNLYWCKCTHHVRKMSWHKTKLHAQKAFMVQLKLDGWIICWPAAQWLGSTLRCCFCFLIPNVHHRRLC